MQSDPHAITVVVPASSPSARRRCTCAIAGAVASASARHTASSSSTANSVAAPMSAIGPRVRVIDLDRSFPEIDRSTVRGSLNFDDPGFDRQTEPAPADGDVRTPARRCSPSPPHRTRAFGRSSRTRCVRMNSSIARARWRDDARRRDDATTRRDALSGRDARRVSERIRTRPDARDAAWTSSAGAGTRVKNLCARCRRRWRRAQSARRRGARGAIRGSGGVGFSGSARFRARFRARACDD